MVTDLCPMTLQACARCGRHLQASAFHPGKRGKVGHYCRACALAYRHQRYGHPVAIRSRPRPPRPLSTSYRAVHKRVQRSRGPASDQPCDRCDQHAEDWAYDHADPDEVVAPHPRTGILVAYSLDAAHYLPMCRSCHSRFDARRLADDPESRMVTAW